MTYVEILRHAADVIERLGVTIDFQIAFDRYDVTPENFLEAFSGRTVSRNRTADGKIEYKITVDGITFEAEDEIKVTTEEIVLPC